MLTDGQTDGQHLSISRYCFAILPKKAVLGVVSSLTKCQANYVENMHIM